MLEPHGKTEGRGSETRVCRRGCTDGRSLRANERQAFVASVRWVRFAWGGPPHHVCIMVGVDTWARQHHAYMLQGYLQRAARKAGKAAQGTGVPHIPRGGIKMKNG